MEDNDAYATVDTPFGAVGLLAPLVPDVAILHAPGRRRARQRRGAPAAARGRVGRARGAAGRDRHRRARSSTTCGRARTWCASPPTACSRCARRRWARTPAGSSPAICPVDGYGEDYEFWVEARAATRERRLRRLDPALGPRRRRPGRVPRPPRRRTGRGAAGEGGARVVAARRGGVPARPRRAASTRGRSRRRAAPATSPTGSIALGADAVLAGAGVANLAAWLGVAQARARGQRRAAHRRDRAVGLRADAGRSVRAQPPQLPVVDDARRRGDGARRRSSAGAGTTTIGCLGGAQVDRHGNVNSTLIPDGPFLVGSGGGNDVARVARRGRRRRDAHPAAHAGRVRLRHVTRSRGARARHRSRHGSRSRRPTASSMLTAVPAGPEPIADRIERARGPRAAGRSPSRRDRRGAAAADAGRDRGTARLGSRRAGSSATVGICSGRWLQTSSVAPVAVTLGTAYGPGACSST